MKEFPFYSTFSSVIKPLVSTEKDKYLAMASLEDVKAFLPSINTNANPDLLPIAFNACVVNRVNKNDDVIDTATALEIYKDFIFKQINAEHNRKRVIGVILTAGFSEFGTDKPLTEEQVKTFKGPFNITLGGVVWKIVDSNVADAIEEAGDPSSETFMKISASWELGFTGYQVVILPDGTKNIENGELVSNAEDVAKYKDFLKALGGCGQLEDGRRVYRQPTKEVLPLGIGVTESPAAEVKGIATEDTKSTEAKAPEVVAENIISQATNSDVSIERIAMITKINSVKEITDESLKQTTASVVTDFISSELGTASKAWAEEKGKFERQLSEAVEAAKKAKEDYDAIQSTIKTLEGTVAALNTEKAEREKVERFNARMESVCKDYELDDEARAAVVEDVKAIASDEDFNKWLKKASIFLKGYAKKKTPPTDTMKKDCDDEEADKAKKAKAAEAALASTVVDNAIDKGQKDKAAVTNTSSTTQTFAEKFKNAFAMENITVKY